MGERRAPQDSQIDLQLRLEQAHVFTDILQRTLQTSGQQDGYKTHSIVLNLMGVDVAYKAKTITTDSSEENLATSFTVSTRERPNANRGENKGRIAAFRASPNGVVRDLSVYDDISHYGMRGASESMVELFPTLKDQQLSLETGMKLLDFMRSPLLSIDLIPELVATTNKKDEEILSKRAQMLAKSNERSRAYERRHFELMEQVRRGEIIAVPGPLEDPVLRELLKG